MRARSWRHHTEIKTEHQRAPRGGVFIWRVADAGPHPPTREGSRGTGACRFVVVYNRSGPTAAFGRAGPPQAATRPGTSKSGKNKSAHGFSPRLSIGLLRHRPETLR